MGVVEGGAALVGGRGALALWRPLVFVGVQALVAVALFPLGIR